MVKLYRILLIVLLVTACIPAAAQDAVRYPDWHDLSANERVDYNTNPAKILPDARAAFQKGEYGRTLMLCSMHWVVYGDASADTRERDELDAKSKRCYDLSREMMNFISSAKSFAQQMLELNPDDSVALKLLEIPEPQPSQPSQASQPSPTPQEQAPSAAAPAVPAVPVEKPTPGTISDHEWVDLDLPSGLKWATCNVGANTPSDYGNYYSWGETTTKSKYDWTNYKFRVSGDSWDNVTFNKYNIQGNYGTVDNKTRLEMADDAARENWGGNWRMPTITEWYELIDNCIWTWTTQGGKKGYKVTSKTNDNSIFLPAAGCCDDGSLDAEGYGYYWASSLCSSFPFDADAVHFYSSHCSGNISFLRFAGFSIRPVTE